MSEKSIDNLKIAIVCDWLTGIGGAERVVLELHKLFPKAPIYTSQYDVDKIDWFKDADIRTTWLQKFPSRLKKFLPVFRARAFKKLDLSKYDLVISASGAEAKAVKTGPKTIHINYCHSPTHYYWIRYEEYMKNPGFGAFNWLARIGLKLLIGPMKRWDYRAAQEPDYMIANSSFTQANIKQYYNRDSIVINPPVDIEKFKSISPTNRKGFVAIGRQVPYKRIDLAVSACSDLNVGLAVIGNGPEHEKLVKLAGPTVSFINNSDDLSVANYFKGAEALIFPGLEDFGITAVEALAAGTPVIAYGGGGAADSIVDKQNGIIFNEQSKASLEEAMNSFKKTKFDEQKISESAEKFSAEKFDNNILKFVEQVLAKAG